MTFCVSDLVFFYPDQTFFLSLDRPKNPDLIRKIRIHDKHAQKLKVQEEEKNVCLI